MICGPTFYDFLVAISFYLGYCFHHENRKFNSFKTLFPARGWCCLMPGGDKLEKCFNDVPVCFSHFVIDLSSFFSPQIDINNLPVVFSLYNCRIIYSVYDEYMKVSFWPSQTISIIICIVPSRLHEGERSTRRFVWISSHLRISEQILRNFHL